MPQGGDLPFLFNDIVRAVRTVPSLSSREF